MARRASITRSPIGWVIVVGVLAVSAFALGGCLVLGTNIAGLIPAMPYLSALILGVSFLALGVLSSVRTIALCKMRIPGDG